MLGLTDSQAVDSDRRTAQYWLKGARYKYPASPNACRDYGIIERSPGGIALAAVPEQCSLAVTPSTTSYVFA